MKKNFKYSIALLSVFLIFSGCNKVSKNENSKVVISGKSDTSLNTKSKSSVNDSKNENNKPINAQQVTTDLEQDKKSENTVQESCSTSNTKKGWYFMPRNDGNPPSCDAEGLKWLKQYNGYYLGDTSQKILYLTFDEGYENGYSAKILDILKTNDVKAAFFVTTPYINANKDLIKRMTNEGHLVCNHTTHHPSMPSVTDINKFNDEILTCEKTFKDLTGKDMPKFFRPPMGEYSETSLKRTNDLGYKSIFWSFAYNDWNTKQQPSIETAKNTIIKRSHNGGIILLHAVSKTNTEILDDLIKQWKSLGFTFKTLEQLP